MNKIAYLQGYLWKKALVDVNNEYNPAAVNTGNTKWATGYVSKAKEPVNQGKDIDQMDAAQGSEMAKGGMEDAPETRGLANHNIPDIPSQIQLPFSKKLVNIGQESESDGALAQNEWQNKDQRSEAGQANFDQEEKNQDNPAGIDKINTELITGGKADGKTEADIARHHNVTYEQIKKQMEMGRKVEREHSTNPEIQKEISKDHLQEFPTYYTGLAEMEDKLKKKAAIDSSNATDTGTDSVQQDSIHRNTMVEDDLTHQSQSNEEAEQARHPYEGMTLAKVKAMNGH